MLPFPLEVPHCMYLKCITTRAGQMREPATHLSTESIFPDGPPAPSSSGHTEPEFSERKTKVTFSLYQEKQLRAHYLL